MNRLFSSSGARAILSFVLVLACGLIFNAGGTFFRWGTHRDIMRQVSVYGVLACGMTPVIISGGIDLSVGSILGLSAVVFALFSIHWGWSALASVAVCLLVGVLLGAISGSLVSRSSIQPFIGTLAMMVFARGLAKLISGGEKISTAVQAPDGSFAYVEVPPIFNLISSRILGGEIATVTLVLLFFVVLCWILLSKMRWGRYLYAIGGNEEAARLAGTPIAWVKTFGYALSGLCGAAAGICQASQELQGDPEAGATYELTAIAMVVIGGTSLRGGSGNIWFTVLGTLTIGYLEKILSINAVGEETRLLLTGLIIIFAVLIQKRKE